MFRWPPLIKQEDSTGGNGDSTSTVLPHWLTENHINRVGLRNTSTRSDSVLPSSGKMLFNVTPPPWWLLYIETIRWKLTWLAVVDADMQWHGDDDDDGIVSGVLFFLFVCFNNVYMSFCCGCVCVCAWLTQSRTMKAVAAARSRLHAGEPAAFVSRCFLFTSALLVRSSTLEVRTQESSFGSAALNPTKQKIHKFLILCLFSV